jgi:hypothetical protein
MAGCPRVGCWSGPADWMHHPMSQSRVHLRSQIGPDRAPQQARWPREPITTPGLHVLTLHLHFLKLLGSTYPVVVVRLIVGYLEVVLTHACMHLYKALIRECGIGTLSNTFIVFRKCRSECIPTADAHRMEVP